MLTVHREKWPMHRLVTNASPKTVWEQLKAGKTKDEIVSAFPDEFHDYIGSLADPLLAEYDRRFQEILKQYQFAMDNVFKSKSNSVDMSVSRKDYAFEFKKHKDGRYFFLLLDNKPIREVLWTELKPRETAIESVATRKE